MIDTAASASLMAWWRDAGVETLVDEAPRNWLAVAPVLSQADLPAPRPSQLPDTLDAFLAWLATSSDLPLGGPPAQRIQPSGDRHAQLMVLIDMPEPDDAASGVLLSGVAGALFDNMLRALKFDRNTIWLAPMVPVRVPGGSIPAQESERIAEIARHHVALVRPKKLWLLGRAASRAILGMDEGEARGRLHKINQNGGTMEAIASLHPSVLIRTPKHKASVWADMQKLIEV